jgi:hypothetical protein
MRYLIGILLFIFLIIFVIIKLLSGGSSEKPAVPPSLASYAGTSTTVRYTSDNPVQAAENHRTASIEVGNTAATLTITKGYDGEVMLTKSYPMSTEGYETFLLSLQRTAGFTLGNDDADVRDERGYCANGYRYGYDIIDGGGSTIQHFWSTSCKEKTFNGLPDAVRRLFLAQIPDYAEQVRIATSD